MHVALLIQGKLTLSKSLMNTSDYCIKLKTGVAENVIHSEGKPIVLTRYNTDLIQTII